MKYFKLSTTTKTNIFGIKLFQLELTVDCKWGKAGTKGGWVEKEENIHPDTYEQQTEISGGEIWGDAVIRGGVIRGGVISGGDWKKAPLQIQGTRHFVNISEKGKLKIGCKDFTFDFWLKNFKEIGKAENYTADEIKEYELYINLAAKLYANDTE